MSGILQIAVLVSYFMLPLQASAGKNDDIYVMPVAVGELKIMGFNVENLFDTKHDAGKNDYEFLPINSSYKQYCNRTAEAPADSSDADTVVLPITFKEISLKDALSLESVVGTQSQPKPKPSRYPCAEIDWTPSRLAAKLKQIKAVVDAQGTLPDVLTLNEVENPNVVEMLRKTLGYDGFAMTTSPDARGIDNAVMYRTYRMTPVQFIEREVVGMPYATRNLSAAIFKLKPALGGGFLAVLPNHLPSQAGNGSGAARLLVANQLRKLVAEVKQTYAGQEISFVLTGDFNTLESESPNPINDVILNPSWPEVNEKGFLFYDTEDIARANKNAYLKLMPPATYYYAKQNAWNRFDRIFVDSSLMDEQGLEIDPDSYRIHAPEFLTKTLKNSEVVPRKYNHDTDDVEKMGYSDHFAVIVKLKTMK
jgi:hypothetical protein